MLAQHTCILSVRSSLGPTLENRRRRTTAAECRHVGRIMTSTERRLRSDPMHARRVRSASARRRAVVVRRRRARADAASGHRPADE